MCIRDLDLNLRYDYFGGTFDHFCSEYFTDAWGVGKIGTSLTSNH